MEKTTQLNNQKKKNHPKKSTSMTMSHQALKRICPFECRFPWCNGEEHEELQRIKEKKKPQPPNQNNKNQTQNLHKK